MPTRVFVVRIVTTRWLYFCGDESVVEDAIIIELEELTDDSKTI